MLALRLMNRLPTYPALLIVAATLITACVPAADPQMSVLVIADGRQRAYVHDQRISIGEFLDQIGLEVTDLDRIVPPRVTQIQDGMTITVVRVEERIECEQATIPYQQRAIPNEGLLPGEERLAQSGVNGIEEVCYRITTEDGQPSQRVEVQRVVITDPKEEIVFVGIDTSDLEAVSIEGTLIYISNGNLWMVRGSSVTKRPLTSAGQLDGKVFDLSADGNRILFTQHYTGNDSAYFNTLFTVLDTRTETPEIQELTLLNNILYAEWIPERVYTFSYSTAEARSSAPGWQAFNDLWLMRLSSADAVPISVESAVESSSGGVYGWWGTTFRWAPDGSALAYSRADSVGLVDLETGQLAPLVQFPVYTTFQDWVWQPTLSWSPDGELLLFTVHGQPFGAEQPENSPIFNISVAPAVTTGGFVADIITRAGIWASPQFSPFVETSGEMPVGYIGYLQARNPLNSVNDQYDLVVADRDGSNARVLFPPAGQAGLEPQEIAWSPSGRNVALIYEGNLWVVEVGTGRAQQLTIDGGASSPQWGL